MQAPDLPTASGASGGASACRGHAGAWCVLWVPLYSGSPLSRTRSREAVTTRVLRPMRSTRQGNSPRRTRSYPLARETPKAWRHLLRCLFRPRWRGCGRGYEGRLWRVVLSVHVLRVDPFSKRRWWRKYPWTVRCSPLAS